MGNWKVGIRGGDIGGMRRVKRVRRGGRRMLGTVKREWRKGGKRNVKAFRVRR